MNSGTGYMSIHWCYIKLAIMSGGLYLNDEIWNHNVAVYIIVVNCKYKGFITSLNTVGFGPM